MAMTMQVGKSHTGNGHGIVSKMTTQPSKNAMAGLTIYPYNGGRPRESQERHAP